MRANGVCFSIAAHAAWAPGLTNAEQWAAWARAPHTIVPGADPALRQMPAMLRRRAGLPGKFALEVAYACLDGKFDVPTVFCSRHGEVGRAIELLTDLAEGTPLSPTGFGLAVHNASAGLFSIARADRANHIALAAGASTVESAVIEACSLLAEGAPQVLLVAYDQALPPLLSQFQDCQEQPYGFAWLIEPAGQAPLSLSWSMADEAAPTAPEAMPPGLDVLRFHLSGAASLERQAGRRRWRWSRHV